MDFETPFRAVLSELGLELYDVELAKGTLSVTVTRPGGIDLESVVAANRAISTWLDENDPIDSRYELDVSSPGLERSLRTPEHFAHAVGETVTLRLVPNDAPAQRLTGTLVSVTGSTAILKDESGQDHDIDLNHIERARTVFVWGATEKPSPSRGRAVGAKGK